MTAARIRLVLKGLTPPYLWNAVKGMEDRLRAEPVPAELEEKPEWEYVPEGWVRRDIDPAVKGWDVDAIVESYRRTWPSFVQALEGVGPLGISHEVPEGVDVPTEDRGSHNALVSYAYVLALAARKKDRIALLDWGGGSGHYYLISRAALPGVEIEYHCKDLPKLVAHGRELFPEAAFYEDDSCLDRRYDLVLASNSLQYSEDWSGTLARLSGATAGYLFVTKLPVALRNASFVVVQRPYAYGYETEYLGWVINRDELLRVAASSGLELVREFLMVDLLSARGAPEDPIEHRGFLFRPVSRSGDANRSVGRSDGSPA